MRLNELIQRMKNLYGSCTSYWDKIAVTRHMKDKSTEKKLILYRDLIRIAFSSRGEVEVLLDRYPYPERTEVEPYRLWYLEGWRPAFFHERYQQDGSARRSQLDPQAASRLLLAEVERSALLIPAVALSRIWPGAFVASIEPIESLDEAILDGARCHKFENRH